MPAKTFHVIPHEVEAWSLAEAYVESREAQDALVEWCGGRRYTEGVVVPTPKGVQYASLDDYIVRYGDTFYVMSCGDFAELFDDAPTV